MAALSLGMIMLGSADDDVTQVVLATIEERQAITGALDSPVATFFVV